MALVLLVADMDGVVVDVTIIRVFFVFYRIRSKFFYDVT